METIDFGSPESSQCLESLDKKLHETFGRGLQKAYLFEIVSSYLNGVDVDKWDYLTRDSQLVSACVGAELPKFDFKALLNSARVVSYDRGGLSVTHIAYERNQVDSIRKIYGLRAQLIQLTIADSQSLATRELLRGILSHL